MKDTYEFCIACMEDAEGQDVCPHCGSSQKKAQDIPLLSVHTVLEQRYLIGLTLHSNAESITYIGRDLVDGNIVAIKEFLPDGLATREDGDPNLIVSAAHERTFRRLFASFMECNRAIARMREVSGIIPIYDIFEDNGTAYTVSELPETISLREFVENNGGQISWSVARPLFMPILSALGAMAAVGVNHLAVTPDNLMILTNGKMKLTGFGIPAVRRVGLGLSPELVTGCSALEQYSDDEPVGEITDIYGFCASLFFALTGKLPLDVNRRVNDGRLLIPTSVLRHLSQNVVTALANGLQVFQSKRTQTFEQLRDALSPASNTSTLQMDSNLADQPYHDYDETRRPHQKKRMPSFVYGIISGVLSLIVLTVVGIALFSGTGEENPAANTSSNMASSGASSDGEESGLSSIEAPAGEPLQVPDFTGKTFEEIQNNSEYADYVILRGESDYSDDVAEGQIFAQDPEAGAIAYAGAVIAVRISDGPSMRKLPRVAGMDLDDARLAIAKAGLECGTISYATNSDVPAGQVIGYKSPLQAGNEVTAGSFVDLVVSQEKNSSSSAN